jgi:regulator of replication initiation timing
MSRKIDLIAILDMTDSIKDIQRNIPKVINANLDLNKENEELVERYTTTLNQLDVIIENRNLLSKQIEEANLVILKLKARGADHICDPYLEKYGK